MKRLLALGLLAMAAVANPAHAQRSSIERLQAELIEPPADSRPMVRWWWFGPAVSDAGIRREIAAMKAGGFGGFEVQQLYPLTLDDPARGLVNLTYLSDPFIAALRTAGTAARASGMRIDVTIGTGWPFGGPQVAVTDAAASVVMIEGKPVAGDTAIAVPRTGPGERLLAAFARTSDGKLAPLAVPAGADRVALPRAGATILFFVATRTGQQVKRAAVGGEGFVLDHLSPGALPRYLEAVGDRLLDAFKGAPPPYAMFSDSLEAYGSSWTDDLPAEFRRRRGYDLLAHLPALFLDLPDSPGVRYDWSRTLAELVEERYLRVGDRWAAARGTRFRAQVYGIPPVQLSSNALVALPEGEGADWRRFTTTRWATSAAHLYGKPVVSSEVWTWLHSPAFRATPLDMKAEADQHVLQGVTQLIGHGWPSTPPGTAEPGWAMYAAAVFNDHNPWWNVMPDINLYLARVSHALRQGSPANGVAIYLPSEDAMAAMRPERASINEAMNERVPPELVGRVLDAGHNFDFVDGAAVEAGRVSHRVLVLPKAERIAPSAYRAIEKFAAAGGRVIALGTPPSRAPGLGVDDSPVAEISARLFGPGGAGIVVPSERLGEALARVAPGDMRLARPDPAIGFIRRALPDGDLYFVVNTSNRPVRNTARFASRFAGASWWDPRTGEATAAPGEEIAIDLAPYESRLLFFGAASAPPASGGELRALADLRRGWTVDFPAGGTLRTVDAGWSWTDDPATRFHSGTARYANSFTLSAADVSGGRRLLIDFGTGRALDPSPRSRGFRAWFEPPVREAAVVTINGRRAGTLWAPPYRIDVTRLVRPGRNRVEVEVANTAINLLAGRAPADYRLLNLRYGERFQAQDMDNLRPLPSGLMEAVTLMSQSR
jgi:hypothetical protein